MLKFSGLKSPVPADTMVSTHSQNGSFSPGPVEASTVDWALVQEFEVVRQSGFVQWAGGARSVHDQVTVEVIRRSGRRHVDRACEIAWYWGQVKDDVMQYRVMRDDFMTELPAALPIAPPPMQPPMGLPIAPPPAAVVPVPTRWTESPVPGGTRVRVEGSDGDLNDFFARDVAWAAVHEFSVLAASPLENHRGICIPCDPNVWVQVTMRNSGVTSNVASSFKWEHGIIVAPTDILAYKVIVNPADPRPAPLDDKKREDVEVDEPLAPAPYPMPSGLAPTVTPAMVCPSVPAVPGNLEWDGKKQLMTYMTVKQGLIVYVGDELCCVELSPGDATMILHCDLKPIRSDLVNLIDSYCAIKLGGKTFDAETMDLLVDVLDFNNNTVTLDR
ncbi:MAG: hypothetical protein JKY11_06675 [Alphaproteobacteria bacterium]|nr:hypothetical protein [Alphaproteobacteria bacterium]